MRGKKWIHEWTGMREKMKRRWWNDENMTGWWWKDERRESIRWKQWEIRNREEIVDSIFLHWYVWIFLHVYLSINQKNIDVHNNSSSSSTSSLLLLFLFLLLPPLLPLPPPYSSSSSSSSLLLFFLFLLITPLLPLPPNSPIGSYSISTNNNTVHTLHSHQGRGHRVCYQCAGEPILYDLKGCETCPLGKERRGWRTHRWEKYIYACVCIYISMCMCVCVCSRGSMRTACWKYDIS